MICEHNSLKRSCQLCELNEEIETLNEEINSLKFDLLEYKKPVDDELLEVLLGHLSFDCPITNREYFNIKKMVVEYRELKKNGDTK